MLLLQKKTKKTNFYSFTINSLTNRNKSEFFVFIKLFTSTFVVYNFEKEKCFLSYLLSLFIIRYYHLPLFIIKNYASTIPLDHRFLLTNTIKRNNILLLYLSNLY